MAMYLIWKREGSSYQLSPKICLWFNEISNCWAEPYIVVWNLQPFLKPMIILSSLHLYIHMVQTFWQRSTLRLGLMKTKNWQPKYLNLLAKQIYYPVQLSFFYKRYIPTTVGKRDLWDICRPLSGFETRLDINSYGILSKSRYTTT